MIANNPNQNTSTHKNLMECLDNIEYEMSNKQYFLLGFFTCIKYIQNKDCIKKNNFIDIYNQFLCDYVIENKQNLFELDEQLKAHKSNSFSAEIKVEVDNFKVKDVVNKSNFDNPKQNLFENNLIIINSDQNSHSHEEMDLSLIKKIDILTCNICQNDFSTEDLENFKLDCGHYMHFDCFKAYLQNQVNNINLIFFNKCFQLSFLTKDKRRKFKY